MPVHLTTQAEMDAARRAVDFCYLCGSKFKEIDDRNADHVIPQALFDNAPATGAWRPILDVHCKCHTQIKNDRADNTAIILHKLYTEGQQSVQGRGWLPRLRGLNLQLGTMFDSKTRETLHIVKGFGDAYGAVWNWIRGLHAVLYKQYLPVKMKHYVYAPFGEMFIPETPADTRQEVTAWDFDDRKANVDMVLAHAIKTNQFDGLLCWGGRCSYVSTWLTKGGKSIGCVWALKYDGTTNYTLGTPFAESPWMGHYQCVFAPPNRAIFRAYD